MIKLINDDCLEAMKNIPDKSIDFILTDIPYGTTACKWDNVIPFEPMWEQINRVIKDNGAVALFGSEPFSSYLRISNIKNYKYDWYWEKERGTDFANCNKRPLKKIETISVFYQKQCYYDSKGEKLDKPYSHVLPIDNCNTYNYTMMKNKNNLDDDGNRKYKIYEYSKKHNLLKFSREKNSNKVHPTQKPVALLEYLIKTYTKENETVLDFTMGSGSTGVACVNTNRNFIGIELDEKYFKIAEQRIENGYVQESKEEIEEFINSQSLFL